MTMKVFTDGGARGNPGPAACAFVVYEGGPSTSSGLPALKMRAKRGKYLGVATNNEAEYSAVVEALSYLGNLSDLGDLDQAQFFLDSSLVVNQLNGLFKIKEPRLRAFLVKIRELEQGLSPTKMTYSHVPREKNAEADLLVNETLDRQS